MGHQYLYDAVTKKKIPPMKYIAFLFLLIAYGATAQHTIHVAKSGNDHNPGTKSRPLLTISAATRLAIPGDVITVHHGIYRERINPPRGGTSDSRRITYQAAPGEKVEIVGSDLVKNWKNEGNNIWKITLPNSFFGTFNPYSDRIHGDWFSDRGREHHTGAVYLDGKAMNEAAGLDNLSLPEGAIPQWFGMVSDSVTTIWAQFKGVNPNKQQVEINVRKTVFYPEKTGINYLTIKGFTLRSAATPWSPPTAEQVGLIGTNWSKGWIIENNTISDSRCAGISLGKYGDEWDNKAASAKGYVGTINRAVTNGWNGDNIGHHIVRNNTISNCEQAGIVGSLGCIFSTITGNYIHDIYSRRLFAGAEMAGIKFHGAIDVTIAHNHISNSYRAVWLDWMAQGSRISANLFHDNDQDIFFEVDHGPFLIDNNILLSPVALYERSEGGAFVHNLVTGTIIGASGDERETPYFVPHSTTITGLKNIAGGDIRFYNNIFIGKARLNIYDKVQQATPTDGNVYLNGAVPGAAEKMPVVLNNFYPNIRLQTKPDGVYLYINTDPAWMTDQVVTANLLGKVFGIGLPFENPDGSPVIADKDYFGQRRNATNIFPGPFVLNQKETLQLKVWPLIVQPK
jgi:alpha-N-arabinofuranosidase